MRYLKYLSTIAAMGVMIQSCRKDTTTTAPASSLTVINAVPGSNPLVTNFGGSYTLPNYYKNALQISYGIYSANYEIGSYSGNVPLILYQYPDTLPNSAPLYSLNLDLPSGRIQTLFLTGTLAVPDTLLTTDNPPYHPPSDSTMGIRFVNLSKGSNPVSVDIRGNANGSEVANLSYKGITGFKNYPTISAISSYVFEFRDVATGALVGSFTFSGINNAIGTNTNNLYRFRNFTLALKGLPGGTGISAQGTFLINNY